MSTLTNFINDFNAAQEITSKHTSVNSTKLPAIYRKIHWDSISIKMGELIVFDFGCGKYTDHIKEALKERNILYIGYDPYWKTLSLDTLEYLIEHSRELWGRVPVIICSNVLNVLPEWEQVMKIKEFILEQCEPYFIKVYEGDKSGVGKMTKDDCWQWNMPTRQYRTSEFEVIRNDVLTHQLYTQYLN